ncbi:MAG TPA: hypothetical protein VN442_24665 [Bryobacteraceae bacterium]|nr:hypothetical protein [Bryobacteraceae bacterium]
MIHSLQNRSTILETSGRSHRGSAAQSASRRTSSPFETLIAEQAEKPAAAPAASGQQKAASSTSNTTSTALPDIFGRTAIENHMNQWLMGVLQRQNETRTAAYNNALEGWKNVNARNREMGLAEIAPPEPPVLEAVAPMEPGWWFETHS